MNKILVFTESIDLPYEGISKKKVISLTKKAAALASLDNIALSIILTDNSYIQEINRTYRKKNTSTDVISFVNRDVKLPFSEEGLEDLGDIFISLEKAREQSLDYGVTYIDEVKRLVVHGILHCAGYDHERSPQEARKMALREEEILKQL